MVLRGARRFGLVLARGRVRRVLLLAGLVFAALPAGSALADTTIGQVGSNPGMSGLCTTIAPGATYADSGYVVPSGGGTITSFSFLSSSLSALEPLDFLVLRPEGSKFRVVASTGVVTLKGTGVETFPANIPVAAGDILGFWFPARLDNCFRAGTGPLFAKITSSDPNPGALIAMEPQGAADLNESANLATGVGGPPPPQTGREWSQQRCASWLARFEDAHKNLTRPQALAANHVLADHSCVIRVLVPPGK